MTCGVMRAQPPDMDHYRNVDNTMRNYHDIAAQWRAWGVTPDKRIAFYCGADGAPVKRSSTPI